MNLRRSRESSFLRDVRREIKTIWAVAVVAIGLFLIPVWVAKVRHNHEAQLMNRKLRAATSKFRGAIRGATDIHIFFGVPEADTPGNQLSSTQKPNLVLRGEEASRLVRALHFEWMGGESFWRVHSGPFAGAIFGCTALEFRANGKKLADLRVGLYNGDRLQARWYGPPNYIGDSRLLPESRDFLERQFGRRLNG